MRLLCNDFPFFSDILIFSFLSQWSFSVLSGNPFFHPVDNLNGVTQGKVSYTLQDFVIFSGQSIWILAVQTVPQNHERLIELQFRTLKVLRRATAVPSDLKERRDFSLYAVLGAQGLCAPTCFYQATRSWVYILNLTISTQILPSTPVLSLPIYLHQLFYLNFSADFSSQVFHVSVRCSVCL